MASVTSPKPQVRVVIGRFQPLHVGHTYMLQHALEPGVLTIILVGSAFCARNIKNPFTYAERRHMIEAWLQHEVLLAGTVVIRPVRDQRYNNAKWIQSVQELVAQICKEQDIYDPEVTLVGSNRDSTTWYLEAFPQWQLRLLPHGPTFRALNATTVRDRLFGSYPTGRDMPEWQNNLPASTQTFLSEFEATQTYEDLRDEYAFIEDYRAPYAVLPRPPIFVTVDAVVIQSGHVLVVDRDNQPGRGLRALPGGFVGQIELLVDAVIRELTEETGISLATGKKHEEITRQILKGSIRAKQEFDDPARSLRGRTITHAYLFRLDDTKALPAVKGQNAPLCETDGKAVVETRDAYWLPISQARAESELWYEDHLDIFETMLGQLHD